MITEAISASQSAGAARTSGRSFYIGMAVLFIVIAVSGFAPRSLGIVTGERPIPPPIIHVHAAAMSAWLLLFLAQTLLMSGGRAALHASLGAVSFVLAPLMTFTMASLVIANSTAVLNAGGAMPLDTLAHTYAFVVFVMGRAAILFPLFYIWAITTRKSDPETHKRMMVLAVVVVIDAALGRMNWLPGAGHDLIGSAAGYHIIHLYQVLLLAPLVVYDLLRFRRVHRATLLGGGLFVAFALTTLLVWNAPAWHGLVSSWAGVGG